LRIIHARSAPVRTFTLKFALSWGKSCFQKLAVLDDGHLDKAGVHYLEEVLVLEIPRREPDLHRWLLRLGELRLEGLDALVVTIVGHLAYGAIVGVFAGRSTG